MPHPSDGLWFVPTQQMAAQPWRAQHAYIGNLMVAELWESGGLWSVRSGTDFFVPGLRGEDEAKELIRMMVDRQPADDS